MCGIAGSFAYHPDAAAIEASALIRVRDAMATRGPDGEGLWLNTNRRVGLAHRRLAILDLSEGGSQPMHGASGRLTITFNGEIYNFRQLRNELESQGHRFHTDSDTEVLLTLYQVHGTDMVRRLRGMFAFALWDEANQSLFLARDAFGIKPLYYADDGHCLRFASQVKALIAGREVPCDPDLAGWTGFWVLGYVPDPHTTYKHIRALPPGHQLSVRLGSAPRVECFFDLRSELCIAQEAPLLSSTDRQSILGDALRNSLQAHQVSDVPVGLFLSAGLDSSTLLALSDQLPHQGLQAVTLGFQEFQGTPQDEVPLARRTAAQFGIPHYVRIITREDFQGHLSTAMEAMDQPSIDGLNTYFVALAAKEAGLKVALSGLGGDELLGGYPSFRQVPRAAKLLKIPGAMPLLGRLTRQVFAPLLVSGISPKMAGLLEYGGTLEGAYMLRRGLFMPWELPGLIGSKDAIEGWESLDLLARLHRQTHELRTNHARLLALETTWYMAGQLLRDSDWAGMAHGVEVRVPFVDIDLFRRLAPIQVGKHPLRKHDLPRVTSSDLPPEVAAKPKTGFTTPVRAWAQEMLGSHREDRGLRGWARVIANPRHHSIESKGGNHRILFLATDAFGGVGGIARFNRDFAEALCLHPDVEEVILIPRIMPHTPEAPPPNLTVAFESSLGRMSYLASFIRRLRRTKRIDLVVCGHVNLLPLARLATGLTGAPQLLVTHGIEAWNPPKGRPYTARLAKRPGHFLSVSSHTLELFRAWTGLPQSLGTVFPNTFTPGTFSPGPKPRYLLDRYSLHGKTILLTVGRMVALERYKGFDEVLELLPRLKAQHPNLAYVAIGEGSDRPRLQQKAIDLGLKDDVVFTGYIAESEKTDHYRMADAYVMPSRGEGFGIVFLEALACGIPVLGSRCDGGRDALLGGALGHLVNPDDPAETLEGIEDILTNPLRPSPTALETFAFPAFTARAHALLDQIWSPSHGA